MFKEKLMLFWTATAQPFLKEHWFILVVALVAFMLGIGVSAKVGATEPATCENYFVNSQTGKKVCLSPPQQVSVYRVYERASKGETYDEGYRATRVPFTYGMREDFSFGRTPLRSDEAGGNRDGTYSGVTYRVRPHQPSGTIFMQPATGGPLIAYPYRR
jgi:hypothetical protein